MNHRKHRLGCSGSVSASILAIALGSSIAAAPAFAQDATEDGGLEVIIVTAQKRSESQQTLPVAITAYSGDDLKNVGVTQPVNLAAQTPNLTTKNAVGNTAPIFALRGISLNDFATNGTQPVGVYVDEVYMVNNSQLSFAMFDVERAEVLKGPQGTLYGRNTTAGAVNFITRKPKHETEFDASLTVGTYGLISGEAAFGGSLSDSLAGRVSVTGERQFGGFFRNDLTGEKHGETRRFAWRGQLLWDAGADTSVLLSVHGGKDTSDNWYYSLLADESGLPEGAAIVAADPLDGDVRRGRFNSQPFIDNESIGGLVKIEHDFAEVKLTSITSYEGMDYARSEDFDSTILSAGNNLYSGDLDAWSQELRLTSTGNGPWKWIVGAFYGHDRLEEHDIFDETDHPFFAGLVLNEDFIQKTESFALFTHNEIELSDSLRVTAGLRYTDEKRSFVGGTSLLGAPLSVVDNKVKYGEWTGKIGVDYRFDNGMIYASYSRGYKAGGFTGFFTFVPEEKDPYKPEFINAYELGFKSEFAGRTLRLNGALFYYDYTDLQAFGSQSGFFRIFNVEAARVKGAELELNWLPFEGFRIDAGASYLDTEVVESSLSVAPVGNRLGNAPKTKLNLAVSYEWDLSSHLRGRIAVDGNYQSDVFYSISNNPNQLQEGYGLMNARIAILDSNEKWGVTAWVKNLTNKTYFGEIFSDGALAVGFPAAPRTFGLTLTYRN